MYILYKFIVQGHLALAGLGVMVYGWVYHRGMYNV